MTTVTTTAASLRTAAPPLYFSPFNFGRQRISPPASLLAPGPLYDLGASAIAHHRTALSIFFVALLLSPLAAFGLGLIANDFGWRPPLRGRRRRASTIRKSSS
jgi:hypothetical protein